MDDNTSKPKLTLADLIAFGRDYLQEAQEPVPRIQFEKSVLIKYLTEANAALEQQRDQARKKKPKKTGSPGGRPPGAGMGEQVLRLIDNGTAEQRALRIVERDSGKPRKNVLRSYKSSLKKSAALSGTDCKNPPK